MGSPRRGENTDRLTDFAIEALNNKNIEVKKYYLNSRNIFGCNACEYCIKNGGCNITDDLTEIINEMKVSDGYIFAAPSYNYNVSSQMKILMDRTFSLNDYSNNTWKSRLDSGKKALIIGVCRGKSMDSMGYTMEAMRKPIDELGVKIIDEIKYFDTKHNPVIGNRDIKQEMIFRIMNNPEFKKV
ncbi:MULTISPECIES: flavodoxin family protein [Psychrilyobacter]|uniref:flavodoxin family protein n=1 Tax=Psychrilyobacter TaxID=623282 RepID=UPI00210145F9|nr:MULTISPECIES: flavodoxin family protein [Psychrilyobacter]MCS5420452.1 flavodoxin family protein [Psychrilyobacter sp. S5]